MRPYDHAKQIFADALDLPLEERAAFVARICDGDDALAREVNSLLAYAQEPAAPTSLAPEVIDCYRVLGPLGEGGMGVVLRAEAPDGSTVALKLLRRELLAPDLVARFAREAKVLAQLDHPGIARLLDSGVHLSPAGPQHWLAIEFIEGRSLTAWAADGVTEGARLELACRLADAVEHAHAQGIVHRDLKPESLLVRANGQPVLLDFGIACFLDVSVHTVDLTRTGLLMGTVRYMSPEQAEGRTGDVGPRSDLYSLAVMTYELLAGRLPYDLSGKSIHSALATLMTAEPQPLAELSGPHRKWLERVLGNALQKRPDDRYESVAEFAADLRRVMANQPPRARAPRRPLLQHRGVRLLAATSLVLAIGVAAMLVGERASQQDPQRQWPALDDDIRRADELIHLGAHGRTDLIEALKLLSSARRRLSRLPEQPWTDELRRFLDFRRGEAELFLGRYDMDAARLRASAAAFELATSPKRDVARHIAMPDSTSQWTRQLDELTSIIANGSRAHALTELSRLEGPLSALRTANDVRRTALLDSYNVIITSHEYGDLKSWDKVSLPHAFRLNESAEGQLAIVACSDSLEPVETSLQMLREARRLAMDYIPPAALASLQHNLGVAFVERARLTGSSADLDSAESRLYAALDWRLAQPSSLSRNESALQLARVALQRTLREGNTARRMAHLDRARVLLGRALADVPADAHALHRTLLVLPLAEVELRAAEVSGDVLFLARADSLLASPGWDVSRKREPVIYAARERLLAMASALASSRFGAHERAASARNHAQNALYAVPQSENPRQARELNLFLK